MNNFFTVDVEDYFQVNNLSRVVRRSDWDMQPSRVERNTRKIMDLLSRFEIKATFFVLGWIAERLPNIVRDIKKLGHEIASHGYAHQLVYEQTPEAFREDVKKAKKILEDIIQEPVLGYRAPTFSITEVSRWAFGILAEEGFMYDSSIFPARRAKGGFAQAQRYPHKISNGRMWEFPISTSMVFGKSIPFSGGGYFRLFPYWFVKKAICRINSEGKPVIVYVHPWEFDIEQPKIRSSRVNNFKHYVNISKTEGKLKQLLRDFEFTSIIDILRAAERA